jgi:cysteine desulfurase / selenocysteine lyase
MTGALTPAQARAEFPATRRYVYLDAASRAPMADRVAEALRRYMDTYQAEGVPKQAWLDRVEVIRAKVARLLGACEREVAFTKSTADSLNLLAHGLGFEAGDNVVLCPAIEHANNVYPWLHLRDRGVEVRLLDDDRGRFPLDGAAEAVDGRTRILAISSVSFVTGARTPLAPLAALCREHDAFLLVDGVQEVGAMRLDVRAAGVDGLGAATQKMLLGTYGLGILYCRAERLPAMRPPFLTRMGVDWGEGHESDLDLDGYRLKDGAARFEVGNPNFAGLFVLEAALSLIEDVGLERIEEHVLRLARRLMTGLRRLGLELVTPEDEHAGLVVFKHPRATELHAALARAGVKVALRRGAIRASVHVYNADDDVDRFLDILDAALPRLSTLGA